MMLDCVEAVDLGPVAGISPLDFEEVRRKMVEANLKRPIWMGGGTPKGGSKI